MRPGELHAPRAAANRGHPTAACEPAPRPRWRAQSAGVRSLHVAWQLAVWPGVARIAHSGRPCPSITMFTESNRCAKATVGSGCGSQKPIATKDAEIGCDILALELGGARCRRRPAWMRCLLHRDRARPCPPGAQSTRRALPISGTPPSRYAGHYPWHVRIYMASYIKPILFDFVKILGDTPTRITGTLSPWRSDGKSAFTARRLAHFSATRRYPRDIACPKNRASRRRFRPPLSVAA